MLDISSLLNFFSLELYSKLQANCKVIRLNATQQWKKILSLAKVPKKLYCSTPSVGFINLSSTTIPNGSEWENSNILHQEGIAIFTIGSKHEGKVTF